MEKSDLDNLIEKFEIRFSLMTFHFTDHSDLIRRRRRLLLLSFDTQQLTTKQSHLISNELSAKSSSFSSHERK